MKGFSSLQITILIGLLVGGFFLYQNIIKPKGELTLNQQYQNTNNEANNSPEVQNVSPKPSNSNYVVTQQATPTPTRTPQPTPNPCPMGKANAPTPDPSVHFDSITPTSGKVGDIITPKGSGFGKSSFYFPDPTKFMGMVSFYGKLCGYNSGGAPIYSSGAWDYSGWTENELKVKVPGVSPGDFQVEVTSSDGKKSNRLDFKVLQ